MAAVRWAEGTVLTRLRIDPFRPAARRREEPITVTCAGREVTVAVRRSARAKRLTLRLPPGAGPVVTVPAPARLTEAERFVRAHAGWLSARLAEQDAPRPLTPGAVIPLRGVDTAIVWREGVTGTVVETREGGAPALLVPGRAEHVERRALDYLKKAARADLTREVARFAAAVARRPSRIVIKDTRAQWGSCSPSGVLSFSWRLVLAPPNVLTYVAAHEVAHLIELNHSAAFWRLNAKLDPDHERARAWLKRHGRALHAVGAKDG